MQNGLNELKSINVKGNWMGGYWSCSDCCQADWVCKRSWPDEGGIFKHRWAGPRPHQSAPGGFRSRTEAAGVGRRWGCCSNPMWPGDGAVCYTAYANFYMYKLRAWKTF